MTQLDRLIELIRNCPYEEDGNCSVEDGAKYLIDNGVIVLPLVVGNLFIPFESRFDYGTMKAFKSNEYAKSYIEESAPLTVFDCEEANDE